MLGIVAFMSEFQQLICRDQSAGVAFWYGGGPYIEVYWSDAMAIRGPDNGKNPDPATPFTNIDAWDYTTGAPKQEMTEAYFREVCRLWVTVNRGNLGRWLEDSL